MNLPKEVYDFFMQEYEKHKVPLFLQGVSSFSGFMAAVFMYAKNDYYRELRRKMRLQDDQTQTKK